MRKDKNVITLGGGTGTFVVLSGLRDIPGINLTAIVSSADDGGSTGRLRDAYGMLPPGDARQALVALASPDSMLRQLFSHRFSKGDISGHSLGNLFITALTELLGSDDAALKEASRILRVSGKVLSVSKRATQLKAILKDKTELLGEHIIDTRTIGRSPIEALKLSKRVTVSADARHAIMSADYIILGPGDLYTSTIATLLPSGVSDALTHTKAKLFYVMNLFTKAGQTEGYTASAHVREIERYATRSIDAIVIHENGENELSKRAYSLYAKEGEFPVVDDFGNDVRVHRAPLVSVALVKAVPEDPVPRSLVRHDVQKLATTLKKLL
ncbi:MAG TPA: YvcK family protein [Candidatus Kaiserbacteria bacterium]|nr:YvcK family protein [Candidatus Kaiserbacteria bacterium]